MNFIKLIKEIQYNTPFRRYFFPRYTYNITPPMICFLCQCLEDTKHVNGAVAEVGCATGETTVFLNKYMDTQNIDKKYYAIDTFSGFVAEDVEFEVNFRGKTRGLYTGFQANKKKWFDGTMKRNNISRVISIEADVNNYDLVSLGNLAFAFVDVDLYRPIKKCLRELYQILSPGGLIAIDDCDPQNIRWDGADQAYKEFVQEMNLPVNIVHARLGLLKKQSKSYQR